MAQTEQKKPESLNYSSNYKYEVSTDLLGLIGKNELPKYTLQLKIHDVFKNQNGTLRLKLGGDFLAQDSIIPNEPDKFFIDRSSVFIFRPGYQFETSFKRIEFFYGADLHFALKHDFKNYWALFYGNGEYYEHYVKSTTNYFEFGLVSFAGISYKITQNISFSIESNLNLFYKHKNKIDYSYSELENFKFAIPTKYISHKYIFETIPVSQISLNIHF